LNGKVVLRRAGFFLLENKKEEVVKMANFSEKATSGALNLRVAPAVSILSTMLFATEYGAKHPREK